MKSVFIAFWCCCFVLVAVVGCDPGMNMMKPAAQGVMDSEPEDKPDTTVPGTQPDMEEIDDPYTPLEGFTVSPNRVVFVAGGFPLEAGVNRCINLNGTNFNGVIYNTHTSKWQHREGPTSPWTDIPGTEVNTGICGYATDLPGQYRAVWEGSIDGVSGKYATNILTIQ